ncbi:MAG: 50S ribosomal protein L37ae [Candidatus Nanoarchaeia archaeon]|nr:50S ribosomal protein L37ae [Candidatus Nanoarchaeia archaeon]
MAIKKKGSGRRFGARYGKKLRDKVSEIEKKYKNRRLTCPYCTKQQVKRLSSGIWNCKACETKFTGKAYEI